jgi:hypothetical protein
MDRIQEATRERYLCFLHLPRGDGPKYLHVLLRHGKKFALRCEIPITNSGAPKQIRICAKMTVEEALLYAKGEI